MWQAERFDGDQSKTALEEMLEFINQEHLLPDEFKCIAIESEEDWAERYVLLYRPPVLARQV